LARAEARLALIDPAKVPVARAMIEAAIGPLALFEVVGGQAQPKPQRPTLARAGQQPRRADGCRRVSSAA
jgi:hypothetical protein